MEAQYKLDAYHSLHTPLPSDALRDAMTTLFELLREEPEASVRAILGHFMFTYIHPYMDGNGRVGRFLMEYNVGIRQL